VKPRLLLTSTLFLFAQMATMQAQETLDLAKITCEQFAMEQLASPSHDVVLWLRRARVAGAVPRRDWLHKRPLSQRLVQTQQSIAPNVS
jgi:hypothetical protein